MKRCFFSEKRMQNMIKTYNFNHKVEIFSMIFISVLHSEIFKNQKVFDNSLLFYINYIICFITRAVFNCFALSFDFYLLYEFLISGNFTYQHKYYTIVAMYIRKKKIFLRLSTETAYGVQKVNICSYNRFKCISIFKITSSKIQNM